MRRNSPKGLSFSKIKIKKSEETNLLNPAQIEKLCRPSSQAILYPILVSRYQSIINQKKQFNQKAIRTKKKITLDF